MQDKDHNLTLNQNIQHWATDAGFILVGIAPAQPTKYTHDLDNWLKAGKHGEMDYLLNLHHIRLDPAKLLPNAKSIICFADAYSPVYNLDDEDTDTTPTPNDAKPPLAESRGRIARYALGNDYHKVLKKRLFKIADTIKEHYPDEDFRCTTDTAPLLEREYAAVAGLGWIGKHTLLIHPKLGSYILIGTILTTLELPSTESLDYPAPNIPPTDHCGSCTRCIDACPTKCIDPEGYTMDGSRCISYLTLEHRNEIPVGLHESMGEWLVGCDICQEVCPHNRPGNHAPLDQLVEAYRPKPHLAAGLSLMQILDWTAEDRQEAFMGSAIKRVKLEMIKRNAIIALTNAAIDDFKQTSNPSPISELRCKLMQKLNSDEHRMVKQTAMLSIHRLDSTRPL